MGDTLAVTSDKWEWFGYAGHLIVGSDCRFHLVTKVGDYIVSSVGDYRPDGDGKPMRTIGGGDDSFFETYVFVFGSYEDCGCPTPKSWGEIDGQRYATHEEAHKGHLEFCRKYALTPVQGEDK